MSNPDKAVMQQALDALLGYKPQSLTHAKEQGSAIIALRAAIAQPAQPVAKDALQREALELSSILAGMCEGGYSDLSTLYTADQPDGDSFVARAAEVLALLAAIAQPVQPTEVDQFGWRIPTIMTFKDVVKWPNGDLHTSCPPAHRDAIGGTVVYGCPPPR